MRERRFALLSLLVGLAIAWATPAQVFGQEGAQEAAVDLSVMNRASSAAHVYVLQEGHMVPVGLVEASTDATLSIPDYFAETGEPVELVADLLGSTEWYKSDPVAIGPPDRVEFTIESELERSTVATAN